MFEAVNENRAGCFGWAVEHLVDEHEGGRVRMRVEMEACTHHHRNKKNFVGKGVAGARDGHGERTRIGVLGGHGSGSQQPNN